MKGTEEGRRRKLLYVVADRCPSARQTAVRALSAIDTGSAAADILSHRAAVAALGDASGMLPEATRVALAALAAETAHAGEGPRDRYIKVRLSERELEELKELAGAIPVSEYVRSRLFE